MESIIEKEPQIRLSIFLIGFISFFLIGILFQYRKTLKTDGFRWINNILLISLNSFIVRLAFPVSLTVFAFQWQQQNFGLLNLISTSQSFNIVASLILLDGIIYWQHILFHKVPFLWRLHAVHHTDTNFDTSTALRFHPIEIILSLGIKTLAIFILGVRAESIIIFEVLLNFSAMFNHSNFSFPPLLEKVLRKLIVTPDFHRIHHSVIINETNSNYGFFLSLWDHIFSTSTPQSKVNLQHADIGIEKFRHIKDQRIDQLLLQPFKKRNSP